MLQRSKKIRPRDVGVIKQQRLPWSSSLSELSELDHVGDKLIRPTSLPPVRLEVVRVLLLSLWQL
jgi:hypothetical protein